jgi:hypothetical protein
MNTFAVPNTASGRAFIRHLRAFSVGMNVRVRGRGPRKRLPKYWAPRKYAGSVPLKDAQWLAVYLTERRNNA